MYIKHILNVLFWSNFVGLEWSLTGKYGENGLLPRFNDFVEILKLFVCLQINPFNTVK